MNNIILIGLPGVGKTSVGSLLAEKTRRAFIDTDALIEEQLGRPLQSIVDSRGYQALRQAEERCLLELETSDTVIATGGSAVYSDKAMQHLKHQGIAIFLDLSFDHLVERVQNFGRRGLAKPAQQSLDELFEERLPLYRYYADITVECDGLSLDAVVDTIATQVEKFSWP